MDGTLFIGNDDQCKEFSKKMNKEFEMSMFGEIKFFGWSLELVEQEWYLHHSVKIYQGDTKKKLVWKTANQLGLLCVLD